MPWIFLTFAGLLEIVWAVALKQSHGFTRLMPSLIMLTAMAASLALLALAMRSLPLGTAYMIWTGIGAVGAFDRVEREAHRFVAVDRVGVGGFVVGVLLSELREEGPSGSAKAFRA